MFIMEKYQYWIRIIANTNVVDYDDEAQHWNETKWIPQKIRSIDMVLINHFKTKFMHEYLSTVGITDVGGSIWARSKREIVNGRNQSGIIYIPSQVNFVEFYLWQIIAVFFSIPLDYMAAPCGFFFESLLTTVLK